jgi:hypothetical protein
VDLVEPATPLPNGLAVMEAPVVTPGRALAAMAAMVVTVEMALRMVLVAVMVVSVVMVEPMAHPVVSVP